MGNRSAHVAGVAIVGGGLIGVSIAWRLAQAGLRVSIFEVGTVGCEASSAGAGMLSPGGEFEKPSRWFDLGIESMRLYPKFVEELRSETGCPIDYGVCGCIQYYAGEHASENERGRARKRAEFQSAAGIRVELSSEGLHYPDDAFVDPSDLLRALRRACEAQAVCIHERKSIREIDSNRYAAVVVAAGAWSNQVQVLHRGGALTLPAVIPVKGHLIGFQLATGTLGSIRRRQHTYVVQRSNGFTIAGSSEAEAGFDRGVDVAICDDIHRRASELFPVLSKMMPVNRWIGFRPRSAEGTSPHIGRMPGTNVWLAYGHYRNGILLAPLTAQRVAGEIVSNAEESFSTERANQLE